MKIYAEIDGDMKEVIPFVWHDVGHSHVEAIGLISRDNWDNIICEVKDGQVNLCNLIIMLYIVYVKIILIFVKTTKNVKD